MRVPNYIAILITTILIGGGIYFYMTGREQYLPYVPNPVGSEGIASGENPPAPSSVSLSYTEKIVGDTKTVESDTYHISFEVPKGWSLSEDTNYGDVGMLKVASDELTMDYPCDSSGGCPKYGFVIEATTSWPHDPNIYRDGTEAYVDGTAASYAKLLAQPVGWSEKAKDTNTIFVRQGTVVIDGVTGVAVNSHADPNVPSHGFSIDVIWLRKGTMNWYIYPHYSQGAALDSKIFQSIKLN